MEALIGIVIVVIIWWIFLSIIQAIHSGVRDGLNQYSKSKFGRPLITDWRGLLVLGGYVLVGILIFDREAETSIAQAFRSAGISAYWAGGVYFGLLLCWIAWRSSIVMALAFIPAIHIFLVFGIFLSLLEGFGTFCNTVAYPGPATKCARCGTITHGYSSTCSGCQGQFIG